MNRFSAGRAAHNKNQRGFIIDECSRIDTEIVKAIEAKMPPTSDDVQAMLARWHQHIR